MEIFVLKMRVNRADYLGEWRLLSAYKTLEAAERDMERNKEYDFEAGQFNWEYEISKTTLK